MQFLEYSLIKKIILKWYHYRCNVWLAWDFKQWSNLLHKSILAMVLHIEINVDFSMIFQVHNWTNFQQKISWTVHNFTTMKTLPISTRNIHEMFLLKIGSVIAYSKKTAPGSTYKLADPPGWPPLPLPRLWLSRHCSLCSILLIVCVKYSWLDLRDCTGCADADCEK